MSKFNSAAIICRVSTREQEDGYSLEAQEKLLREYCDRKEFDVVFYWAFSETASKYELRKKFQEFVREVKRLGISIIVAEKVDRLSRSGSRDAVLIDEWIEADANRHVHFVKQSLDIHKHAPSTAKFVWSMHVAVAKHTSDNLSEEVTKATDVMLKKGIWPTGTPVGYVRDKANLGSPIQVDRRKAHLVETMFRLYASGEWSIPRLADEMKERGLVNTRGKRIMPSRIHLMLQDKFYIGLMTYRGKEWDGVHEPIVSQILFDDVQKRLKRNTGGGSHVYRSHCHLLRGLAVCGGCGLRLTWEIHGDHTYGYCRRLTRCTARTSVRQDRVEKQLIPFLEQLIPVGNRTSEWIHSALLAQDRDKTVTRDRERARYVTGIQTIENKLGRLLELRLEGEIERADYENKKEDLHAEKRSLLRKQRDFESSLSEGQLHNQAKTFERAKHITTLFLSSSYEEKRRILVEVFSLICVGNGNISVVFTKPFEVLLSALAILDVSKTTKTQNS